MSGFQQLAKQGKTQCKTSRTVMLNSKITEILKSIGNRRRLQILWELSDGKERSVSQIEEVFPI